MVITPPPPRPRLISINPCDSSASTLHATRSPDRCIGFALNPFDDFVGKLGVVGFQGTAHMFAPQRWVNTNSALTTPRIPDSSLVESKKVKDYTLSFVRSFALSIETLGT